jgi:hypothetical protein
MVMSECARIDLCGPFKHLKVQWPHSNVKLVQDGFLTCSTRHTAELVYNIPLCVQTNLGKFVGLSR